jgi:hypothetical protein
MSGGLLNQVSKTVSGERMRAAYDIRGGVRGKYYEHYRQRVSVVELEPDVTEVFHNAESVNQALRMLIPFVRKQAEAATSPPGTASN